MLPINKFYNNSDSNLNLESSNEDEWTDVNSVADAG